MRERDIGVSTEKAHGTGEANEFDSKGKTDEENMTLSYSLVLEVVQRGWAGWILRRMREAMEMKPKQWTEIQAGLGCLTQLVGRFFSMYLNGSDSNSSCWWMPCQLLLMRICKMPLGLCSIRFTTMAKRWKEC
jgi:hypothetical protein